jgi:hypothetical protein
MLVKVAFAKTEPIFHIAISHLPVCSSPFIIQSLLLKEQLRIGIAADP